ncbi:hypothetical protein DW954_05865 [Clostridium sp. AM45-5]|nr:hypothetical protein DW954_05865 [Clostridium sp. AM45-5]
MGLPHLFVNAAGRAQRRCERLAVQGWLWGLKHCMGGKSLVRWNEGEKSKETKEKKGGTEKAFSYGRSIL